MKSTHVTFLDKKSAARRFFWTIKCLRLALTERTTYFNYYAASVLADRLAESFS